MFRRTIAILTFTQSYCGRQRFVEMCRDENAMIYDDRQGRRPRYSTASSVYTVYCLNRWLATDWTSLPAHLLAWRKRTLITDGLHFSSPLRAAEIMSVRKIWHAALDFCRWTSTKRRPFDINKCWIYKIYNKILYLNEYSLNEKKTILK